MGGTVALLRLLQITDSSFPVGGFAFSHGLEWLVQHGWVESEADVAAVLDAYVVQAGGGQWLPAALACARTTGIAAIQRWDDLLDASMLVEGERNAGRAMGERLLAGASDAFAGERIGAFLDAVREGRTPGQYAAVYGVTAAEAGVEEEAMLAALGSTMVNSIASAAVRLGTIGQAAAIRITAAAAPVLAATVARTLERRGRPRFGAFTPGLDVAGLLHSTLPFRMFAS